MATHMSIRLAWHNEGWNGHICQKPCENSYCIGQHSYPGDLIASTRDIEYEMAHAGEPCSKNPCAVACGLSVNAFGKDTSKKYRTSGLHSRRAQVHHKHAAGVCI